MTHLVRFNLARVMGRDKFDVNTADYNVGLLYLAEAARSSGASVGIFDGVPASELVNDARNPSCDIIGFNVHYLNINETIECLKIYKSTHPHSIVVLGGDHASGAAQELLADIPEVDGVC